MAALIRAVAETPGKQTSCYARRVGIGTEPARYRLKMLVDRGLIRRERRDDQPAPTVCYWPVEDWRP